VTRDEYDALVDRVIHAIIDGVDPESDDAVAAREEAQLLEAEARAFADAVDRSGKRLDYGEAVMLEGDHGVVVVAARDYADAPIYWRTVAGDLDQLILGPELIEQLTARAGSSATP
jgi:hypothetical protein